MTEKPDFDISELSGQELSGDGSQDYELSEKERCKLFGFKPFDMGEANNLARILLKLGAEDAGPVIPVIPVIPDPVNVPEHASNDVIIRDPVDLMCLANDGVFDNVPISVINPVSVGHDDETYFEVDLVTGKCPEGVRVEVYRGHHAESVDFILKVKIDSFDDGDAIIRKLKRMMRRRDILEKNGYHLRTEDGYVNDSRPGINEKRDLRIAYTKPLDTRVTSRVEAELHNIMNALFRDFENTGEEVKDQEADIW